MISLFNNCGSFRVNPNQSIGAKLITDAQIKSDENDVFFIYILREEKTRLIAEHIFKELNGDIDLSKISFKSMSNKQFRYRLLIIKTLFVDNVYDFMLSNCFSFLGVPMTCNNFNDVNSIVSIIIPSNVSHNSTDITITLNFSLNSNFLCSNHDPSVKDQRIHPNSVETYIDHSSKLIEKLLTAVENKEQTLDKKNNTIRNSLTELEKVIRERDELKKKNLELEKTTHELKKTTENLRQFVTTICLKRTKIENE